MARYKVITLSGISILLNYIKDMNTKISSRLTEEEAAAVKNWALAKENIAVASAELASIEALIKEGPDERYELDFLATDTDDCESATNVLKKVIGERYRGRVEVGSCIRIKGLQVNCFEEFEREGKANLADTIGMLVQGYEREEVLINITAGFKVFVPYLTLIAQMNRFELIYTYEKTNRLVRIPSVMDVDMERYRRLLRELKEYDDTGNA